MSIPNRFASVVRDHETIAGLVPTRDLIPENYYISETMGADLSDLEPRPNAYAPIYWFDLTSNQVMRHVAPKGVKPSDKRFWLNPQWVVELVVPRYVVGSDQRVIGKIVPKAQSTSPPPPVKLSYEDGLTLARQIIQRKKR